MKKSIITVVAFSFSCAVYAQKINSEKVPTVVKETLKKSHPAAMPKWEWEDKAYEANFKENGREVSCIITKEGLLKETETAMPFAELPQPVKDYVTKNHPNKKVKESAKIVTADGTVSYEVETAGKELLFDAVGNFKEQKKD